MPQRAHLLLIVPPEWQDHPPGLVALRDYLARECDAALTVESVTATLRAPLPLFSGVWPIDIDGQLAPRLARAFYWLGELRGM